MKFDYSYYLAMIIITISFLLVEILQGVNYGTITGSFLGIFIVGFIDYLCYSYKLKKVNK